MLVRYLSSLLLTLLIIAGLLSSLPFATRSQVRAGETVAETWAVDFVLRSTDGRAYRITDAVKAALEEHVSFVPEGPLEVRSVNIQITPKTVTWRKDKTNYSDPGGQMVARVTWSTSPDARDGDHGDVRIFFGKLPDIPFYRFVFYSGAYQKSPDGTRWMFREVTIWRTPQRLFLARMLFALGPALSIAILLHAIYWGFCLARERKRRTAELAPAPDAPPFPRTFYPNPVAEWVGWTFTLCVFALMALIPSLIAIFQRYQSTFLERFILIAQAIGLLIALIVVWIVRSVVVTIRIDDKEIAYARGRGRGGGGGEPNWITSRWSDLRSATVKQTASRGGVYTWIALVFPDGKTRNVPASSGEFRELRYLVMDFFSRHH
jgi:hypothetical protein